MHGGKEFRNGAIPFLRHPRPWRILADMDRPAREVRIGSGCVPNIGATGRRMRYAGAAVAIVVGLAGAARVILARQPALDLLTPALCFLASGLGYFQAREKT